MKLFQGEYHACERRSECARETRACAACHENFFFSFELATDARHAFSGHCADLDAGTLTSQRQPRADGQAAADDLCHDGGQPLDGQKPPQLSLYLGDAGR